MAPAKRHLEPLPAPSAAERTSSRVRARHELARTACLILYKAYVRLVDLCLFECEPIDRDGVTLYRNSRATCNAEAARRDTMGVLCAAMTVARHALALEGSERLDHRVYSLLAASLLVAQKAKTEQQWAEGSQPAAIAYSVVAPREVVMASTAADMTRAVMEAELWLMNKLPIFALCERNPHAATEAALHTLEARRLCTLEEAADAVDRFFSIYWTTIGSWDVEVWFGSPDAGYAQSQKLGAAFVCCLLPRLACHIDVEANALATRILRLREVVK